MRNRRWLLPLLVALVAILWLTLGRFLPKDQTVHIVLGDAAPRVTEVHLRYAPASEPETWDRGVEFSFSPGTAPRVATHTARLADGDYHVEIEVVLRPATVTPETAPETRARVDRKVRLEGG